MAQLETSVATPSSTQGLALFFRCHAWLMALDVDRIVRIVSAEDVRVEAVAGSAGACVGLLHAERRAYCAWDLGLMLEMEPTAHAWALLELHWRGQPVPLALGTGSCYSVGPLGRAAKPLPARILRAREGAIASAFSASAAHSRRRSGHALGLKLDPTKLWSDAELQLAIQLLRKKGTSKPV